MGGTPAAPGPHAPRVLRRRIHRALLILVIAVPLLRWGLWQPAQVYLLDFRAYYAAGLAVRGGVDPYDLAAVRAGTDLPGAQRVMPYVYPPPSLAVAAAASLLPYPLAQLPWMCLQLGCLAAAAALLSRAFALRGGWRLALFVAALWGAPAERLAHWGQFDGLIALAVSVAVWSARRGRQGACGAWLGLAACGKLTPLAYGAALLGRRERRALAALTAAVVVGGLLAAAWLGPGVFASWRVALTHMTASDAMVASPDNVSLRAMLTRWLPPGGLAAGIWLAIAAAAAALFVVETRRRRVPAARQLAACSALVVLLSPITWTHHLVQALPALALGLAIARRRRAGAGGAVLLAFWLVAPVQQGLVAASAAGGLLVELPLLGIATLLFVLARDGATAVRTAQPSRLCRRQRTLRPAT